MCPRTFNCLPEMHRGAALPTGADFPLPAITAQKNNRKPMGFRQLLKNRVAFRRWNGNSLYLQGCVFCC
jgi:hypothetical protein